MKKLILALLLISLLFTITPKKISYSHEISLTLKIGSTKAYLNGEEFNLYFAPFIKNGRTAVPLRNLSYAVDAKVKWDAKTKSIKVENAYAQVVFFVGNKTAFVNSVPVNLYFAPFIKNGRTAVPLRNLSEFFGLKIRWDSTERRIVINGDVYPLLKVKDDLGNEVTFKSPPKRIVSLAPSNTEILFAVGAGDQVVGVTDFCNYPEDALKKEKVGGFSNPNIEKIISLKPDFVFGARGNPKDLLLRLSDMGIKTLAFDPRSIEDVFSLIKLIGDITDHPDEANELLVKLMEKRKKVDDEVKKFEKKRVYLEIWNNPYMSAGKNTFVGKLIEEAGGINIAENAKGDWPILSQEYIIKENPEVIILGYMGADPGDVKKRPGWENIDAVKNGRIYTINPDLIFRPGPRIIDGLYELFKFIHGESLEVLPALSVAR